MSSPEYQPSYSDFSRLHTSYAGLLSSELPDEFKSVGRYLENSEEKSFLNVIKSFRDLETILHLSENDLQNIMSYVSNINNIQYKNSYGIILGYYVLKNNRIDVNKLNNLEEYIYSNLDYGIQKEDVIRYARLLLRINN
jgi:hypothetical protein